MARLSIVIPAFNERDRIGPTLQRIGDYVRARALEAEVLVVDDGSTDTTADLVRSFPPPVRLLQLAKNSGKGAAVRAGVLASTGHHVLICDADLSTPIEDLGLLEEHADENTLVFGSRAAPSSNIELKQPWYRQRMGQIFNFLLRLLGVRGVRDTQCGFKLLPGDLARDIFQHCQIDGFAFDVELLLRARRKGAVVREVGVTWQHVEASRVHPLLDSARMLRDTLLLRLGGL